MKSKRLRNKKRKKVVMIVVLLTISLIIIFLGIYNSDKKQTNIQTKGETQQELEQNNIIENNDIENAIRRFNRY